MTPSSLFICFLYDNYISLDIHFKLELGMIIQKYDDTLQIALLGYLIGLGVMISEKLSGLSEIIT